MGENKGFLTAYISTNYRRGHIKESHTGEIGNRMDGHSVRVQNRVDIHKGVRTMNRTKVRGADRPKTFLDLK